MATEAELVISWLPDLAISSGYILIFILMFFFIFNSKAITFKVLLLVAALAECLRAAAVGARAARRPSYAGSTCGSCLPRKPAGAEPPATT